MGRRTMHALRMLDRLGVRERFAPHPGVIDTMVVTGPEGGSQRLTAAIEA
jgi:menaquinone-9 beta-reductase